MCNDLRFPKFLLETSVALQMWMRRSTKSTQKVISKEQGRNGQVLLAKSLRNILYLQEKFFGETTSRNSPECGGPMPAVCLRFFFLNWRVITITIFYNYNYRVITIFLAFVLMYLRLVNHTWTWFHLICSHFISLEFMGTCYFGLSREIICHCTYSKRY